MNTATPSRMPWVLGLCTLIVVACLSISSLPDAQRVTAQSAAGVVGELVARPVAKPPLIDGHLDALWDAAPVATIPLTRSLQGNLHALDVRLRAAYTADAVYFYAEWPGERPPLLADTLGNRFTMHLSLDEPWPGANKVMCLVACHTALMDELGRSAYVVEETIPAVFTDPLPAAGHWGNGQWRLEWGRPLVSANRFAVQFDDLRRAYPFFLKVYEHRDDLPDPVSARYLLRFGR
jgi:hypothetical protein